MSLIAILDEVRDSLRGRTITEEEAQLLGGQLGALAPPWLLSILAQYPLVGSTMSLPAESDASGLGAEMMWLDPHQMISEATEVHPGIEAARLGCLPVGACLEGSGDYYFLRICDGEDPALVRILHEVLSHDGHTPGMEVVCDRLSQFVATAYIR